MVPNLKVLGNFIKDKRGNEPQASLCKRAGVSPKTLVRVEEGEGFSKKRKPPRMDSLIRLADALGVKIEELCEVAAIRAPSIYSIKKFRQNQVEKLEHADNEFFTRDLLPLMKVVCESGVEHCSLNDLRRLEQTVKKLASEVHTVHHELTKELMRAIASRSAAVESDKPTG